MRERDDKSVGNFQSHSHTFLAQIHLPDGHGGSGSSISSVVSYSPSPSSSSPAQQFQPRLIAGSAPLYIGFFFRSSQHALFSCSLSSLSIKVVVHVSAFGAAVMASKELIDDRSSLEKKRAVKEERLQSHLQNYRNDVSARRSLVAATSDPSESVDAFLASFSHSRDQVEDRIASIRSKKSTKVDEAGLESVREELKSLLLEISNMETMVANSSFYLPTYSIQSSQTSIIKLKEEVEAATAELLPKKKFSFRSKTAKPTEKIKEMRPAVPVTVSDSKPSCPMSSFYGIKDQQDCTLVRYSQDLEDREYMLTNLSNCRVYLIGKCRALYVNKLRNCQVCTGPVTGSVLIDDVEGSTLMLASQQIRIHSTKNTDFYLRVRSRPIVEYTSSVRFAPYAFHYSGAEDALQAANLQEETGEWENVDDFRWLRAVQSPNWSILPSIERISIDATDVAEKTTTGNT